MLSVVEIMSIRVFVASNFRLLLEGIETLLSRHPARFHFSGKAENLDGLPDIVLSIETDLLLLDIDSMPTQVPTQVSLLNAVSSHLPILLLTRLNDRDLQDRLLIAGARGVIDYSVSPALFLDALEKVHEGQVWLNRESTGRLWSALTGPDDRKVNNPGAVLASQLTEREKKILMMVLRHGGESAKGIAERLHMSESTLRNYLTAIYKKCGVSSRSGLLAYSLQNGLTEWFN
jgi:two-component system nitrate/nitrite response regulator NarL